MYYDWETPEDEAARKRSRPSLYAGLVMAAVFLFILRFSLN